MGCPWETIKLSSCRAAPAQFVVLTQGRVAFSHTEIICFWKYGPKYLHTQDISLGGIYAVINYACSFSASFVCRNCHFPIELTQMSFEQGCDRCAPFAYLQKCVYRFQLHRHVYREWKHQHSGAQKWVTQGQLAVSLQLSLKCSLILYTTVAVFYECWTSVVNEELKKWK